ncbi:MAG: IclR family transcriptional regulator [Anaerolineae bacterium]|nr:MAG: IclR family transcriptional regulator [Anaerolineae bacterium]
MPTPEDLDAKAEPDNDRYKVRAVDRALRVLVLLSDGKPRNLNELSEDTGIDSSTIFRLLSTLSYHNFVVYGGRSSGYRLEHACLELASAYLEGNDLRRSALPDLELLRDSTGETVHLGILDQMEVIYIEKLQGHHAIGLMSSQVGGRAPAYCTGLGKALLAHENSSQVREYFSRQGLQAFSSETIPTIDALMSHLELVRARGYALDLGEHEPEVRCVGTPLFDIKGKAVAAISISGPRSRLDPLETRRDLIRTTLETAKRISGKLGYHIPRTSEDVKKP